MLARLAQSVERQALNLVVGGSSPPVGDLFFFFEKRRMAETVVSRFTALAKRVADLSQQLNRVAVVIASCTYD